MCSKGIDSLNELLIQHVLSLELVVVILFLLSYLNVLLLLPGGVVQSKTIDVNLVFVSFTVQLEPVFTLTVSLVELNDNSSELFLSCLVILAIPKTHVCYFMHTLINLRLILFLL